MTDTSRPSDNGALRGAIDALTARLDRIEAQAFKHSAVTTAEARRSGAWLGLRGSPHEPRCQIGLPQRRGLLWPFLTVCAVLLALILAVKLVDEVFDSLWHLGRRID
jgi:hypothetical protein